MRASHALLPPPPTHSYLARTPSTLATGQLPHNLWLKGHIVVLSHDTSEHFTFCSVLRASHLPTRRFYPIVFVVERPPTPEEWAVVAVFPFVYYVVGLHARAETMRAASVERARRVVILSNPAEYGSYHDEQALMDSASTYVPP